MVLTLENITKKYGANIALDDFNYSFTPGVYGLLGPNGAGKTTLINIITDNINTNSGRVLYNGVSTVGMKAEYRRLLGFMPQQQGIYSGFTLERFLWYMAALKGINKKEAKQEIEKIAEMVNLKDCMNKKLGSFSGGMKQRALVAQAVLGNPEVIILDEPTAGLDPKERIRIRNLISEIAFDKIVIIATHVVSDIEFIAKEILLLKNGKLIDSGSPHILCSKAEKSVFEIKTSENELSKISGKYKVGNISRDENHIYVRIVSENVPEEYEYKSCKPELEDLYLYYFD